LGVEKRDVIPVANRNLYLSNFGCSGLPEFSQHETLWCMAAKTIAKSMRCMHKDRKQLSRPLNPYGLRNNTPMFKIPSCFESLYCLKFHNTVYIGDAL
jgi:hypothetical protein